MPVVINGTTGIVSPKVNTLDLELDSKNVVERGSNANGEYVRFADGTQICVGPVPGGNSNKTVTFPATFINTATRVSASLIVSSAETGFVHSVNLASVSTTSAVLCPRYSSASGFGVAGESGQYNAIGRWY